MFLFWVFGWGRGEKAWPFGVGMVYAMWVLCGKVCGREEQLESDFMKLSERCPWMCIVLVFVFRHWFFCFLFFFWFFFTGFDGHGRVVVVQWFLCVLWWLWLWLWLWLCVGGWMKYYFIVVFILFYCIKSWNSSTTIGCEKVK